MTSNMIIHVHSNASYLSKQNDISQVCGHYLSSVDGITPANGAILTLSTIIKNVVSSATKTNLSALFYN